MVKVVVAEKKKQQKYNAACDPAAASPFRVIHCRVQNNGVAVADLWSCLTAAATHKRHLIYLIYVFAAEKTITTK